MLCHFLLASIVSNDKSAVIQVFFLLNCHIFLISKFFFFVFIFQKFVYCILGMEFLRCMQFGVCSASCICRFIFFKMFQKFLDINSLNTFLSSTLFLLSFWNFGNTSVRSLVTFPLNPEPLFLFFSFFFFLFFRFCNFSYFIFQFANSLSLPPSFSIWAHFLCF